MAVRRKKEESEESDSVLVSDGLIDVPDILQAELHKHWRQLAPNANDQNASMVLEKRKRNRQLGMRHCFLQRRDVSAEDVPFLGLNAFGLHVEVILAPQGSLQKLPPDGQLLGVERCKLPAAPRGNVVSQVEQPSGVEARTSTRCGNPIGRTRWQTAHCPVRERSIALHHKKRKLLNLGASPRQNTSSIVGPIFRLQLNGTLRMAAM
jgi:hypothetical protein